MLRELLRAIFGGASQSPPTHQPESDLRRILFGGASNSISKQSERADKQAMVDAILDLRAVVKRERVEDIKQAVAAFKERTNGVLDEKERQGEIADAEVMIAAISIKDRIEAGEDLPVIATLADGQPCYFVQERVWLAGKRDHDDDLGTFELSDRALFYRSVRETSLPWTKVMSINLNDNEVAFHKTTGGAALEFRFRNRGMAKIAHVIAITIWNRNQQQPAIPRRRARQTEEAPKEDPPRTLSAVGTTIELPGSGGGFPIGIVGESRRQSVLRALGGDRRSRDEMVVFEAAVVPEPTNSYDPNAIAIYIKDGSQVGYLSREDAVAYGDVARRLIERNAIGLCRAKLIGGTPGKASIGAMLDLAEPATVTAALGTDQTF
jgi:hypothetical protein